MSSHRTLVRSIAALLAVLTVLAFAAVTLRLRIDPNVSSLLPREGEAAALRRYVEGFGGGDLAVVLVEGDDPTVVAASADEIAAALAGKESVAAAASRIDLSRSLEPMLVWRHADVAARERLEGALTTDGMKARLEETRALLLAPGSGALAEEIAKDPLRLRQLVFEGTERIGSGVRTQADGAFATDDGRAHLVMIKPRGQALRGEDARAFVRDVDAVLAPVRAAQPELRVGLTGGHAIAAATEEMLTRDLTRSGSFAMILASVAFVVVFRRVRALLAVMPPLFLGTVWTAALATLFPGGLSGVAVAFMSVVIGVGVDTGVHVYAAILEARRDGLSPEDAARVARQRTMRPVLIAASTAGAAFAALVLSDIEAIRQLGILCAAGEVLTAIAIVIVTPEIGARLERGPPPAPSPSTWTLAVAWVTATRARAAAVLALSAVPILAIALGGAPPIAESLIAVRPQELAPMKVQQAIFDAFGGKRGQWVVLIADPDLTAARRRADIVAEQVSALGGDVEAVDALTALAPAPDTQGERFEARDALDGPALADRLARALEEVGFSSPPFAAALEAMRSPPRDIVTLEQLGEGASSILLSRYLGEHDGDHLVAIYVRPSDAPGAAGRIEASIAEADPEAMITGYARLEHTLRASLARDLPRIGLAAGALVLVALGAALRRARDVGLAALVVLAEVSAVLVLLRVFEIPLHVYDALVLPVLLGITVDEAMFLLYRARELRGPDGIAETLRVEGPPVATTALTTAAGFGALASCEFDGLADLGAVGAIGSVMGLLVALAVVPAGLRLALRPPAPGATGSSG